MNSPLRKLNIRGWLVPALQRGTLLSLESMTRFSKDRLVKVHDFSGATLADTNHHIIPISKKKPDVIFLMFLRLTLSPISREIVDDLLQLKSAITNPTNICWSSRRLQDMSCKRLWYVFSVTIFRLPRRLEGTSQGVLKTSWRRLEDMSWRLLEDRSWRFLENMSWRCLQTSWRQTKYFLELSVSNKSKYASNKSGISQIYTWRI